MRSVKDWKKTDSALRGYDYPIDWSTSGHPSFELEWTHYTAWIVVWLRNFLHSSIYLIYTAKQNKSACTTLP